MYLFVSVSVDRMAQELPAVLSAEAMSFKFSQVLLLQMSQDILALRELGNGKTRELFVLDISAEGLERPSTVQVDRYAAVCYEIFEITGFIVPSGHSCAVAIKEADDPTSMKDGAFRSMSGFAKATARSAWYSYEGN